MAGTFFLWFQSFLTGAGEAFMFLTSHPFEKVPGLETITPLGLITIGGLVGFFAVALVKWLIN